MLILSILIYSNCEYGSEAILDSSHSWGKFVVIESFIVARGVQLLRVFITLRRSCEDKSQTFLSIIWFMNYSNQSFYVWYVGFTISKFVRYKAFVSTMSSGLLTFCWSSNECSSRCRYLSFSWLCRCPFRSCKTCCLKAKNVCEIHGELICWNLPILEAYDFYKVHRPYLGISYSGHKWAIRSISRWWC